MQLKAIEFISCGSLIGLHYGTGEIDNHTVSNDAYWVIGVALRDINEGDTVEYKPSGTTSDITTGRVSYAISDCTRE